MIEYLEQFPDLIAMLSKRQNSTSDVHFEQDLFPDRVGDNCIEEITKWIKEQSHYNAEKRTCGDQLLEKEALIEVMKAVSNANNENFRSVILQVKPNLLFMPGLQISSKAPDPYANHRLFDRIIIVKNNYIVPLGYRGTIIGMHSSQDPNPIRQEHLKVVTVNYDILFDKPFDDGSGLYGVADNRVYRVSETAFINVSYGLAKNGDKEQSTQSANNSNKVNAWQTNNLQDKLQNKQISTTNSRNTVNSVPKQNLTPISYPTSTTNASSTKSNSFAVSIPIDKGFPDIWESLKQNNVPQTFHIENSLNKKIGKENTRQSATEKSLSEIKTEHPLHVLENLNKNYQNNSEKKSKITDEYAILSKKIPLPDVDMIKNQVSKTIVIENSSSQTNKKDKASEEEKTDMLKMMLGLKMSEPEIEPINTEKANSVDNVSSNTQDENTLKDTSYKITLDEIFQMVRIFILF